jgi:hypothetical protein
MSCHTITLSIHLANHGTAETCESRLQQQSQYSARCTLCRRHIVTRQPGRHASRAAHATSTCSACIMGSEMVGTIYQEHQVVTPDMWYPCRFSIQILQCPTVVSICSLQTTPPTGHHLPAAWSVHTLSGMSPIIDLIPHQ